MMDTNFCPCGSSINISECCLPIIQNKRNASTAEELLRARYTAFTQGEIEFILKTHHSRTRKDISREEISDWAKNSEWVGLQILQTEAGKLEDQQGTIVFCARYKAEGKLQEHWEKSFFEKEEGLWYFVDAQKVNFGPYRREEAKIGRNAPCPCGSGKKYKKCCAN